MRILCLSTWFPYPPDNGAKIRAYHLIRSLAASHAVTLVAFHPTRAGLDRRHLASELRLSDIRAVPADPFRYVGMPQALKFCSPIPVAYWPSRLMRQAVAQAAAQGAASGPWNAIVSIQPHVGRCAAQIPSIPRILDVDTSLSFQMYERHLLQNRALPRLQAWVSLQKARRYESELFRSFHLCTVVSPAEIGFVESMLAGSECRVEPSPNGVDCRHFQPGLVPSQPGTLIYNGALTYAANYDAMQYFLAEIYPPIQAKAPGVSLTITGSTAGVDRSALVLDGSVHFSGYVEDIRFPVAGASVCVVPLRQGSGTRLKILEAMALGTPVVSTSKGAEGLAVTSGQDILIADDPAEFATQVVRLLGDVALRERLVANARRLVERTYDWAEIGRRFVSLVEQVASENVSGRHSL
jgi:glycosyltransferase involved in cell wall biosynthesis